MIHRAMLGSLERFIGILIEHTVGGVPLLARPRAGARAARSPTANARITPKRSCGQLRLKNGLRAPRHGYRRSQREGRCEDSRGPAGQKIAGHAGGRRPRGRDPAPSPSGIASRGDQGSSMPRSFRSGRHGRWVASGLRCRLPRRIRSTKEQAEMPKMKTHRGAAKRFKSTATGRFKRGPRPTRATSSPRRRQSGNASSTRRRLDLGRGPEEGRAHAALRRQVVDSSSAPVRCGDGKMQAFPPSRSIAVGRQGGT